MDIFTIDIGGAFIKTSLLAGNKKKPRRKIIAFELWKEPKKLEERLKSIKPKKKATVAITMTGELCDCFKSRASGVRHIAKSAESVFGKSTKFFAVGGNLLSAREAIKSWREVASANWAITPLWLSVSFKNFLHVDIGSTTTDLTPVKNGKIANKGFCDFDRLANGELLYTGYLRTPVPAVVNAVTVGKLKIPISSETFAIMGDLHLISGSIKPRRYNCATPDGAGKTAPAALTRLARTLLAERGDLGDSLLKKIANDIALTQRENIVSAAKRFRLKAIATGTGAFILDGAFKSGALAPLELAAEGEIDNMDPSLSLGLLIKNCLL